MRFSLREDLNEFTVAISLRGSGIDSLELTQHVQNIDPPPP